MLRYKIYISTKDHQMAIQSLDSIYFSSLQIDSLKVLIYQKELGKDFLSKHIDSSLIRSSIDCGLYDCFAEIPITEIDQKMRLKIHTSILAEILSEKNKAIRTNIWLDEFKKSSIYFMIKGKS